MCTPPSGSNGKTEVLENKTEFYTQAAHLMTAAAGQLHG